MLRKLFATGSLLTITLMSSFAQQNNAIEVVTPPADSTAKTADEPEKKPALTISGSADTYLNTISLSKVQITEQVLQMLTIRSLLAWHQ